MKRFSILLLSVLCTAATAFAYDFQSGDLYYTITSSTTVTVTYQENQSNANYQGLTTAIIPETVTYNGTTYSVTRIDWCAFEYCSSLTSVTIPNSVTSIEDNTFSSCSSLTSVTIPNSVTSIGSSAFSGCSSLTSITIPNSVISIGWRAFNGCSSLTSITIPNSVTSIGQQAFFNVPNVVYDGTATGSPWDAKSVNGYIDGYVVYSDETKTTLLACSAAATGAITIPESATKIGDYAFCECSSLSSITIPNSVTIIGSRAFSDCSSLASITIPNSITSIGSYAFYGCSSLPVVDNLRYADTYLVEAVDKTLSTYTIKEGTTWVGFEAFRYCDNLKYITIPNSIKRIGGWTFVKCSALSAITIPNSVIEIGDHTFYFCDALTSITIPNSVTSIGELAFCDCSSLTSISIPNSVTSIGELAFIDCYGLTSIVVESGNTMYDSRNNCNAIIEKATNTLIAGCQTTTIPNSVTSIGRGAFWGCLGLTSINLPNSVTSIGSSAFEDCSSLTSITIPNSVTSIGWYAFRACSSLTSITCLAPTPPTCGDDCFYNVPRNIPLYVPAESVEAYKAADTWKEFDIQALPSSYSPVDLVSITVDGEEIADFDPKVLTYNIALPSETVAIPVVDAVANDPDAQVLITQAAAIPGEASVEVIAADGTTRQTYTIYFSKKSTPTAISDSHEATESASDKAATKLLRDGQVVIIRNGETFDMMGQRL